MLAVASGNVMWIRVDNWNWSGQVFLQGYHAALEENDVEALAHRLNEIEVEYRGFAFEGAAMGLALLDSLTPWKRNRWLSFVRNLGAPHIYMVHVGVGWALARLPWLRRQTERPLAKLDPLLRWLAIDGYGFHEGYFHWPHYVRDQHIPKLLSRYALRVFDQGLGRSLWFVDGADVERIAETIGRFGPSRHADLWSGVGLACAYAGGVDRAAIEVLPAATGEYLPHVAQGVAFAAKARKRAGNPAPHTELACQAICGMSSCAAAGITDLALENLPPDDAEPAYEAWRRRIQAHFAAERMHA